MMDELRVTGVEVVAHHGVLESERRDGQTFVIDLRLGVDLAPAAASDDLADTVDYGALIARVTEVATGGPYALIERLAGEILEVCLAPAGVAWAEVTVHKPGAPVPAEVADIAVTLRRDRAH